MWAGKSLIWGADININTSPNVEIHGNTIPHLHTHIFPRYPGDPFEGKPIDPRLRASDFVPPVEHSEIRQRVIARLHGR